MGTDTEILKARKMMKQKIDICDFHAHILPRADHGSSSIENSIGQLSIASKCGVSRIVATPHFYPHKTKVSHFLSKRDKSYMDLAPNIPENISIRLGAEVLLCDNIENLPDIEKLCIAGSNILLLELPFTNYSDSYADSASVLIDKGINIVLAHAERYDPIQVQEFIALGAKVQINAKSLLGLFSPTKAIMKWLYDGDVVAIGSDIHGLSKTAYKGFDNSFKKINRYLPSIKAASDAMWEKFEAPNALHV